MILELLLLLCVVAAVKDAVLPVLGECIADNKFPAGTKFTKDSSGFEVISMAKKVLYTIHGHHHYVWSKEFHSSTIVGPLVAFTYRSCKLIAPKYSELEKLPEAKCNYITRFFTSIHY